MIFCLVWFSLMTREGEIGMKLSTPGDIRGPGTFFTPCITLKLTKPHKFDISLSSKAW
jgi:hypothetical protein